MKINFTPGKRSHLCTAAALLVLFAVLPAGAQLPTNAIASASTSQVTNDVAWVEEQLKELESRTGLDEATKSVLENLLNECRELITSTEDRRKERDRFAASRLSIPDRLAALQNVTAETNELTALLSPSGPQPSLSLMEETLAELESELASKNNRQRTLQAMPRERTERSIEITRQLADARNQLQALTQPTELEGSSSTQPEVTALVETVRRLKSQNQSMQVDALMEERRFYEASRDLLTVELETTARTITQLTSQVEAWRAVITEQRQGAVDDDIKRWTDQAEQARQVAGTHPLIEALIRTNRTLVEGRDLGPEIDKATRSLARRKERLRMIEDKSNNARARLAMIEGAGVDVDEAIGQLLRREFLELPDYNVSKGDLRRVRGAISTTLTSLVSLQDRRSALHFVDSHADQMVEAISPLPPTINRTNLHSAVVTLLTDQRTYLERLINDHNSYLKRLLALEVISKEINEASKQFGTFILEHVLWIRSAPRWSPRTAIAHLGVLGTYWPAAGFAETWSWLRADFVNFSSFYILTFLAWLALLRSQPFTRQRLASISQRVRQSRSTPLRFTVEALIWTALKTLRWPLPLFLIGLQLRGASGGEEALFVESLGKGLIRLSVGFFIGWSLRELCRTGGTAEVHFGWSAHNCRVMFKNLTWAILATLPLVFAVSVIEGQGFDATSGQGFFLLHMIITVVFAHRIFRPGGGLQWHPGATSGRSPSWQGKTYYLLGVSIPLVEGVTAYMGYYYSALEIATHVRYTIWAILACVLIRALLLRWLEIVRHQVVEKEEQRKAEEEAAPAGEKPRNPPPPRTSNLANVLNQSRSLVHAGLWILFLGLSFGIWSKVFPAFSALDNVPVPGLGSRQLVSTTTTTVTDSSSPPSGMPAPPSSTTAPAPETSRPKGDLASGVQGASVADLLTAVLIIVIGVAVMRNLPGLFQLLLLNRLDLRPGVGYAVATMVRYSIVLLVAFLICAELGITWAKVQWIAAAFSLGIAFGLQEMFANFFSGLIILFERPIRIGDIVTVGDISGNITRINIRATTITDWDRREFLVPNKEFITSRLLNWTLSDPVTRILVPVGIAYGSDTERATQLLLEAARENPHVMADPAPRAIFWGFGDNSLDFRLYVHVASRNFYFDLLHTLTGAINLKFKEAGITIAFPQRDVHLHSTQPIDVRVLPGGHRLEPNPNQPPPTTPPTTEPSPASS